MVCDGQMEVNELFEFVKDNAKAMAASATEEANFSRIMVKYRLQ